MKSKLQKIFTNLVSKIRSHPKITILVSILAVLGIGVWLALLAIKADNAVVRTSPDSSTVDSTPVVTYEPSPLTGLDVNPDIARGQILAAIIENSPSARPQSSLDQAGVVIEAPVEGGITRFLAFYLDNQPKVIGPIRSVRPYFVDWFYGFDAAIAHVGGSPEALSLIKQIKAKDLDEFANSGAYYRASDRYAPHNAYSSYDRLANLMKAKGYTSSDFEPWPRKDDEPAETPTATTIDVDISSLLYNVQYVYNPSTNSYKRYMAGNPHKDRETTKQIQPKVVIVMKIPMSVSDDVGHLKINTIGSGSALIFQDGVVTKATWRKSSRKAQIIFTDSNNKQIPLNKGQTWITVIAPEKSVTY